MNKQDVENTLELIYMISKESVRLFRENAELERENESLKKEVIMLVLKVDPCKEGD